MTWCLLITDIQNGYLLSSENDYDGIDEKAITVHPLKDCGHDEDVQSALLARDLLYAVVEHFELHGDKYAQRNVKVCLDKGTKYEGEDTYKDEWGELFEYGGEDEDE